jgi:hypothetical protein
MRARVSRWAVGLHTRDLFAVDVEVPGVNVATIRGGVLVLEVAAGDGVQPIKESAGLRRGQRGRRRVDELVL